MYIIKAAIASLSKRLQFLSNTLSFFYKDLFYIRTWGWKSPKNYEQFKNMLRLRKGEEHLFMMITYGK